MRVLLVHNSYQQRGGEDVVFEAERDLLAANGHDVIEYRVHNDDVGKSGALRLAAGTIWSRASHRALRRLVEDERPDVAHFHNTLPLISPAGYDAVRRAGVPVVQTLHNYRLICPSAMLFRDGDVCRDCVGSKASWSGIKHGCYRGSRGATATVAGMLWWHRRRGTYRQQVDRYIALTEFARQQHIAGGLPADRLVVKPNFLAHDPGAGENDRSGLLFVGRLTPEKGVHVLLAAARRMPKHVRLTIAGDGPLRAEVERLAAQEERVRYVGPVDGAEVIRLMKTSRALVFPSLWFEGFPMTIVEAFACGLPVLASDLGSMASIVDHERTGLRVPAGDVDAWALAMAYGDVAPDRLGQQARADYLARYSAAGNYRQLLAIYQGAAGVAVHARTPVVPRTPAGMS